MDKQLQLERSQGVRGAWPLPPPLLLLPLQQLLLQLAAQVCKPIKQGKLLLKSLLVFLFPLCLSDSWFCRAVFFSSSSLSLLFGRYKEKFILQITLPRARFDRPLTLASLARHARARAHDLHK
jgi:hypothetical protein